jgi:hypothetical protein
MRERGEKKADGKKEGGEKGNPLNEASTSLIPS